MYGEVSTSVGDIVVSALRVSRWFKAGSVRKLSNPDVRFVALPVFDRFSAVDNRALHFNVDKLTSQNHRPIQCPNNRLDRFVAGVVQSG